MTDEDGRIFHIRLKKPVLRRSISRFLLPTIGFTTSVIYDDDPEHEGTKYFREDTIRYRLCVAWWCWQFSVIIAEWTDDRTDEEVERDWGMAKTVEKVEDSQL